MQPAQLSLMPEQIPAPPPEVIGSLPETGVTAAIKILARLIAHAATTTMTGAGNERAGNERAGNEGAVDE